MTVAYRATVFYPIEKKNQEVLNVFFVSIIPRYSGINSDEVIRVSKFKYNELFAVGGFF